MSVASRARYTTRCEVGSGVNSSTSFVPASVPFSRIGADDPSNGTDQNSLRPSTSWSAKCRTRVPSGVSSSPWTSPPATIAALRRTGEALASSGTRKSSKTLSAKRSATKTTCAPSGLSRARDTVTGHVAGGKSARGAALPSAGTARSCSRSFTSWSARYTTCRPSGVATNEKGAFWKVEPSCTSPPATSGALSRTGVPPASGTLKSSKTSLTSWSARYRSRCPSGVMRCARISPDATSVPLRRSAARNPFCGTA